MTQTLDPPATATPPSPAPACYATVWRHWRYWYVVEVHACDAHGHGMRLITHHRTRQAAVDDGFARYPEPADASPAQASPETTP